MDAGLCYVTLEFTMLMGGASSRKRRESGQRDEPIF